MDLSEYDKQLLELAALKVPWYMVCGEFHERYGSPGDLARRLFELRDAQLLVIRAKHGGDASPTPAMLERDALDNDNYDELDSATEPLWDIVATNQGFDLIKDRLDEQ